jgi:hypothetical protein
MTIGLPNSAAQIDYQFNNELNLNNDRNSNQNFYLKNISMKSTKIKLLKSNNFNAHNQKLLKDKNSNNSNYEIKKDNSTKENLYIYLLRLIKFIILSIKTSKLILILISNFILINIENIKIKLKDTETNNNVNLFDRKQIIDINHNFIVPKHICIILNEIIDDTELIYQKLFFIAQYMSKLNFEYLSFYQFDGKIIILLN